MGGELELQEQQMTTETQVAPRSQQDILKDVEDQVMSCIHCGLCLAFCHSFEALGSEASSPRGRVHLIRAVAEGRMEMSDRALMHFCLCSLCNRCQLGCPVGMDLADLVRSVRGELAERLPEGLRATVAAHIDEGNNMAVSKEDYLDAIDWMQEELQEELEDPDYRIPIDVKGAKYLYTFNPREPRFFPLSIKYIAKIFHAAGESWTTSSEAWDGTNYALFNGVDEEAREISRRLFDRARELEVETVVSTECGHGYYAMCHGSKEWLGEENMLPVISVVELMARYIREGRIEVDPSANPERVTYHDPCHLARKGGIMDEPREILKACVQDFVELPQNRENCWCCGGGGGTLAMSPVARDRQRVGEVKNEQIKATGATVVATACHNCCDQLTEIRKVYKEKYAIKNLSEIVADALVL
jgi:Fe-S oxidoreductase